MQYRYAQAQDAPLLAGWNYELIRDEGHSNPMTLDELETRMRGWLAGEYRAAIFSEQDQPVAYALWRQEGEAIYLRHFFVARSARRHGAGRQAISLLCSSILPHRKIRLEVLVHNTRARTFWHAVGFSEYAVTMEHDPPRSSDKVRSQ